MLNCLNVKLSVHHDNKTVHVVQLHVSLTSDLNGASNFAPQSLFPLRRVTAAIVLEAETRWAPEPVWTYWRRGKFLERTGNRAKLLGRPIAAFCVSIACTTWFDVIELRTVN